VPDAVVRAKKSREEEVRERVDHLEALWRKQEVT
jgi:hypothetical protein